MSRGTKYGRVDVAAANEDFSKTLAVEIKRQDAHYEAEGQLFDAVRAADLVYIATPPSVWQRLALPSQVGVLEAHPWPVGKRQALQLTVRMVRLAQQNRADQNARRRFLHAIMQQARKRQGLPENLINSRVCPACLGSSCSIWGRTDPVQDFNDVEGL